MDRTRHPTYSLKAFNGQKLEEIPITKPTGELFELEGHVAMLIAAIRDGGELPCSGEDGRWSVAMCMAAARSVESGGVVSI